MVHGIGAAFLGIAIYNMAVAISDENAVGRQLGKVQSAQSTGVMIGAVLCFIIVGNVDFLKGWYRLFIIFSVMSLIGALLISLGIKEDMKMTTSKENLKLNIKYSKDVLGLVFITFIPFCIIYSVLGSRLGYLGNRYGYIKIMIIGIGINSIIAFSIPSTQHIIVLGALWCADAVGDLIEGTSRSAFLSKIVGQERRGEVYGICGTNKYNKTMETEECA